VGVGPGGGRFGGLLVVSVTEMQAYLARLYVDRAFRRLFEVDPESALLGYKLTSDERRAVENIDMEKLSFFAASLVNKRKERIQRAYPLLYRLNADSVDHYFQRYSEVSVADPHQASRDDVISFGYFFEDSTKYADSVPGYASDLAKFERLTYSTTVPSAADEIANSATLRQSPAAAEDRPVRRATVYIETFMFDFIALAEEIENDVGPGAVSPQAGECRLLVIPAEDLTAGRVMRVNDATDLLFNLCDGKRTLRQIVAEIERRLDTQQLEKPVRESVERLVSLRALRLVTE
jgi:hypothetical protein